MAPIQQDFQHQMQLARRQFFTSSASGLGAIALSGLLLGDSIASFRTPIAGHPPPHWAVDLDRLDIRIGEGRALEREAGQ